MLTTLTKQSLVQGLASRSAADEIENAINAAQTNPFARHFYVNSTAGADGAGVGSRPEAPYDTIAFALTQCVAGRGDVLHVSPDHVESIATAAGIAMSKAGVTIIGYGYGSWRPTLTWTATASTFAISAANCSVLNVRCTSSIDEMVKMFHVTAANCRLIAVDVFETASCQIIQFLLTTTAATNIEVSNCRHIQRTAATATQVWIQLVAVTGAKIRNNVLLLTLKNEAASYTIGGTTACVDALVENNTIQQGSAGNTQDKCVSFVTTSTGVLRDNVASTTSTGVAITTAFVGDAMAMFDNKWADTIATSGLLTPAVDTDT